MTPEEQQRLEKLETENQQLREDFNRLKAQATIPFEVDAAFTERFNLRKIKLGPLAAVTSPIGGGTQDAEARTAIDALITRLENLNLILPN